ncbi:hypothetical protein ES707_08439 [subsurface metagenome]
MHNTQRECLQEIVITELTTTVGHQKDVIRRLLVKCDHLSQALVIDFDDRLKKTS